MQTKKLMNDSSQCPTQYQKGFCEFYGLKFAVTPDVLIPRPETELLVDAVIQFVKDSHVANAPRNDDIVIASKARQSTNNFTILDLGTGSGAIAITLAKNLPTGRQDLSHPRSGIKIIATDISERALEIAKKNAQYHHVQDKITFLQSDLLSYLDPQLPTTKSQLPNIIVTNLPYIPTQRVDYLDSSVKDYEPRVALDGGSDGFELYRKLFQQIVNFMNPPLGWVPKLLVGEIDYTHGEQALFEAQKYFPKALVEVKKDLSHLQRILTIKWTDTTV